MVKGARSLKSEQRGVHGYFNRLLRLAKAARFIGIARVRLVPEIDRNRDNSFFYAVEC